MNKDFTVTLIGNRGRFSTQLKDELDFATHPCEVCLLDLIYTPGSWGNVRIKSNWLLVLNKNTETSATLFLPPGLYASQSELLYGINEILCKEYGPLCDLFMYCDRALEESEIVYPLPPGKSDANFVAQKGHVRFRSMLQTKKAVIKEEVGMKIPHNIQYGGGKNTTLTILFSVELAIIMGVVDTLAKPAPLIVPGWSIPRADVNVGKNNLMMMWVYANFVETTMLGSHRGSLLKIVPIIDDIKTTHTMFSDDDFIAVQKRRIQEMEVWMKEGPSSSADLLIDEQVILQLYFRPLNVLPPNHH